MRIPIIILGGRDRRGAALPERGRDNHPLTGYKGVDIRFRQRPLVETLLERLAESRCFEPVYLAGPASIYREFEDRATLVDTDGTFGENVHVALDHVTAAHAGSPVAFITCDVIPELSTLVEVFENYKAQRPCDMWYPFIRIPRDRSRLGASGWKPSYRVILNKGEPPIEVLPGHLIVVDPEAMRLKFVYRLLESAYRTRNRSIHYRLVIGVGGVLARLLYQDLKHLLTLRAPGLTWSVLRAVVSGADALQRGTLTQSRAEDVLRTVFVKARHQRRFPDRKTLLPVLEGLSLALDIDTEEEARAMGGDVRTDADDASSRGADGVNSA